MPEGPCPELGFEPLEKKMEGTFVESQRVPPRERWEASAVKPTSALVWGSPASKTLRTLMKGVWVVGYSSKVSGSGDARHVQESGERAHLVLGVRCRESCDSASNMRYINTKL